MPEQLTTRELRARNRSRVLRELVLSQESTRAGLALALALSPATITNVLADLEAEGLVEDRGSVPSDGGRPIVKVGIRAGGAYVLGADVGEKGVAVELFDLAMTRVDREFRDAATRGANPAEIATALQAAVDAILGRNTAIRDRVVGLGLGLPGIVEDAGGSHAGHGVVLYAQSLGWPAVHLDELVDVPGLQVLADNGAKALAAAEIWFGSVRGVDDAVVALLGRGVGLGLVSSGRLLRGARSSAGEWGHTKIAADGRVCRCGGRGCLEAHVGSDALIAAWRERGGEPDGSGWRALDALVAAADRGDAAAVAVVDEALGTLALSLANLVNLTNPQKVVIGGWVGLRLMRSRRDELEARIREASLQRPGSQFELELCQFEGDSVALGAALLPLEKLIETPVVAVSSRA
ncbi:ROK family protein [Actinotalea sp. M2MS4P-6]|uniref:ROK family protein n=1 Tax=Actinotalea sp. M2MS4P-6 TaxID=2983762 RepID=UPI0021E36B73|nr:ROK family protein [Actinotalea sp. M2MS4P-6]MCV2395198.1 ROK family protein [Actinotalea sp. M2MS4P-6]